MSRDRRQLCRELEHCQPDRKSTGEGPALQRTRTTSAGSTATDTATREAMAEPQDAQFEVYDALLRHFDRTDQAVEVPEIMEMTGLDENAVQNALRVLHRAGQVEGNTAAEISYPFRITAVNYG